MQHAKDKDKKKNSIVEKIGEDFFTTALNVEHYR